MRSSSNLGEVVFHFGSGRLPFLLRSSSILGKVVFHFGCGCLLFLGEVPSIHKIVLWLFFVYITSILEHSFNDNGKVRL